MNAVVDVVVGTIGRAHGLKGEVTVRVQTDYPDERFASGAVVRRDAADGPELRVVTSRWQGPVLLVGFEGHRDRSSAETLRGVQLWARVEAGADDEGDFHDAALIGLDVRAGGRSVGRIGSVVHNPAQDLLVIGTDQGERLVPFVTELVPTVDLDAGYVEVIALPGLLEDQP